MSKSGKRLLFLPQNIEQKISKFYKLSHKMKGQMSDLTDYRGLVHYPKTSTNTTLSPILGKFGALFVLNNVKCVKKRFLKIILSNFPTFLPFNS